MTTIAEYNSYGEELERNLILRTSPIAVKMLEKEEDIPEGAIRPKKDRGVHYALCQAFALSRRQKLTVAMLKEDHWCFAPLIGFGLAERLDDPALEQLHDLPCFTRDKYIGTVSAPLRSAGFEPDVVIIYSNNAQLRNMMMALDYHDRHLVSCHFYIDACVYQIVPVMTSGRYMVTLPDPGDYERALAGEDEIILSVPAGKIRHLISGLKKLEERNLSYARPAINMQPDFPQPDFYRRLFRSWGLDEK